jgi:hypothetical protein
MPRKKFGVTPNIFVAGVEVEDDGFGGVKEFGQQAKFAIVGAMAFRSQQEVAEPLQDIPQVNDACGRWKPNLAEPFALDRVRVIRFHARGNPAFGDEEFGAGVKSAACFFAQS